MERHAIILILFVGLLFSCQKERTYTVYYKAEVQALDHTKPFEAKIAYQNALGGIVYETISTGEWSGSRTARNGEHAFLRVYGIENINLINITVIVNNDKYSNSCNTLNCLTEIDQNIR